MVAWRVKQVWLELQNPPLLRFFHVPRDCRMGECSSYVIHVRACHLGLVKVVVPCLQHIALDLLAVSAETTGV
eukprot:298484-Ditylum_brightwellii.AAC.1